MDDKKIILEKYINDFISKFGLKPIVFEIKNKEEIVHKGIDPNGIYHNNRQEIYFKKEFIGKCSDEGILKWLVFHEFMHYKQDVVDCKNKKIYPFIVNIDTLPDNIEEDRVVKSAVSNIMNDILDHIVEKELLKSFEEAIFFNRDRKDYYLRHYNFINPKKIKYPLFGSFLLQIRDILEFYRNLRPNQYRKLEVIYSRLTNGLEVQKFESYFVDLDYRNVESSMEKMMEIFNIICPIYNIKYYIKIETINAGDLVREDEEASLWIKKLPIDTPIKAFRIYNKECKTTK